MMDYVLLLIGILCDFRLPERSWDYMYDNRGCAIPAFSGQSS